MGEAKMLESPVPIPKLPMAAILSLLLLAAGCTGSNDKVVGVWKGKLVTPSTDKNMQDALASALLGDGITIEFNKEGRFKETFSLGSSEGAYKVSGDEVRLLPDDPKVPKGATFKAL